MMNDELNISALKKNKRKNSILFLVFKKVYFCGLILTRKKE